MAIIKHYINNRWKWDFDGRHTYDLWCRLPNNRSVQIWRRIYSVVSCQFSYTIILIQIIWSQLWV